jgi:L-iditol 2-dehydrogenase
MAEVAVLPGAENGFSPACRGVLDAGAFAEPLACCLHTINLAGIRSGDVVGIVGGGTIGLLLLQLAQKVGARRVLVSEPNPPNAPWRVSSAPI